ncbi:MAG TPA: DUF4440 domain-containing protein [Kangiella sp.]
MFKSMSYIGLVFISVLTSLTASGENSLTATVLEKDNQFWQTYNTCNMTEMRNYFTKDMEFYHDKSGLTSSREKFMTSIDENLCGESNSKLQRKAIKETIKVFPLNHYGAIISGKHAFYRVENGHQILHEVSQFTHIWNNSNDGWKMSRMISYDHQPPPESMLTSETHLSDKALNSYIGQYHAPNTGTVIISRSNNQLSIQAGKMNAVLYHVSETLFRHPEAPLTFEFIDDGKDSIVKMIVRENGTVVEEANRL